MCACRGMPAPLLLPRRPVRLPRLLAGFPRHCRPLSCTPRRGIVVLGIETSCDDTSVALLEHTSAGCTPPGCSRTALLFHRTVTSDNFPTRGIHPLASLSSHRTHLAPLLADALRHLPRACSRPDIVAATRGPGMRASLAVGLDVAKGLALAWGVPLVGVNHMLGHALTARLVSALGSGSGHAKQQELDLEQEPRPRFPFWSLLVSGGHTLVVRSESVMRHWVACDTADIAVGDMLDKVARVLVPEESTPRDGSAAGVVYGRVLEEFAFPHSLPRDCKDRRRHHSEDPPYSPNYDYDDDGDDDYGYDYGYYPPGTALREAQDAASAQKYPAWSPLPVPFMSTGSKHHVLEFSFSGIGSSVERALKQHPCMGEQERRHLARQTMQVAFEHLAKRVLLASREHQRRVRWLGSSSGSSSSSSSSNNASGSSYEPVQQEEELVVHKQTLVLSGGVAANSFLRYILKRCLCNEGLQQQQQQRFEQQFELVYPPPKLCTDNAAMIAWAGLEIWEGGIGVGTGAGAGAGARGLRGKKEAGWATELGCHPVRRWSLDSSTHGEGSGNGSNACGTPGGAGAGADPGDAVAKGMFGVDSWVSRGEWERRENARREEQ